MIAGGGAGREFLKPRRPGKDVDGSHHGREQELGLDIAADLTPAHTVAKGLKNEAPRALGAGCEERYRLLG